MMSEKSSPGERERPYPWVCFECGAQEVFPKPTFYTTTRKHDGRSYPITIPDLAVPTCRSCGSQTFSVGDDEPILAALRAQIGLLAPREIKEGRGRLGMTQQGLAEQLGIAKETISRWETGALIQSRGMDHLLRLYFSLEAARRFLGQRASSVSPCSSNPPVPTSTPPGPSSRGSWPSPPDPEVAGVSKDRVFRHIRRADYADRDPASYVQPSKN